MKVIDLLNKIANGEEVPKKIKYKGHIYQYQYKDVREANIINYYHSDETHHHLIDGGWHDIRLNDEVEIIEEKKIPEKLLIGLKATKENEVYNTLIIGDRQYELNEKEEMICKKIHEIIDYLQSKGEK